MKAAIRSLFLSAALVTSLLSQAAFAESVRLAGSTTMINAVINPNRAAVEKATGHTLDIVGNGSGKGLADLIDQKADAAMLSDSLEVAARGLEAVGKKIDASALRVHEIRKGEIVFITHPSNPVTKLTFAQLSDIHTGKISNWKQVGGSDKPITLYSEPATGGIRSTVKKLVMGDAEYASSIKSLTSIARVADLVAGDESGVGAIAKGFVKTDGKNRIIETTKIEQPLVFVTVGDPQGKVKQVIDAMKQAMAAK